MTRAEPRFDAVAIGASAGGVNALISIVKALPASFAPAMLVVMHVPPERPSSLACLLGEHCALPVAEALDKQPIEAGTVTLAPSGYHMLVEPGRSIALSFDEPVLFSRPAIDPTFESAALAWRERLLAVLLTGASADGTAGAAAVRAHGGTLWIEDPATAHAATMPESALRAVGADAVVPLERIGPMLAELTR
ncbi:MAG: chemotaxis protein CheB [Burkholderiaceae bacterium]|nr:chemotaxis protein CheB [Burkholderiaceae bacterium]